MKRIAILIVFMAISIHSFQVKAQDCATINNFSTFHGLKFGDKFPDSLKKYFNVNINTQNNSYIEYELPDKAAMNKYSNIKHYLYENSTVTQKFSKWFFFEDEMFSNMYVSCLTNGDIFEFSILKDLCNGAINDSYIEDSVAIIDNKIPPTYYRISDKVRSLFGEKSKQDGRWVMNAYYTFTTYWECEKNEFDLVLSYFPGVNGTKMGLMVSLVFKDKELEKTQKLKALSN